MSQLEDTNFIFKYIYFAKKIGYLNKSLYLHNVKNSNSINRESYKVNQSIIFCLENLFIQITKYINKKTLGKKYFDFKFEAYDCIDSDNICVRIQKKINY